MLDAETVEWFKENGGLTPGQRRPLPPELLSRGGSVDPMDAFRDFRGREPSIEPLLERRGLALIRAPAPGPRCSRSRAWRRAPRVTGGIAAPALESRARAARSRAAAKRSRPRTTIDSKNGGPTVRPVTATRTGAWALPSSKS